MKLRNKIAGTLALPLALAIASSVNAATVFDDEKQTLKVGGFIAAQAVWEMPDAGDANYVMDLGTSRLNIAHTTKTSAGDITVLYENDWSSGAAAHGDYRLRHAAVMYDGWVAGKTWSFFANLNGLSETFDASGVAITSSWANRNAVLGKNISLGEDMSVGIALEDRSLNSGNTTTKTTYKVDPSTGLMVVDKPAAGDRNTSAVPDITANFKAKVGGVGLFAAIQYYQVNDASDAKDSKGKVRFTASAAMPVADALTFKVAFTSDQDEYKAVSASGQYRITDKVRTNLVIEQYIDERTGNDSMGIANNKDRDYTQAWLNAIYRMDSGLEWGAELHMLTGDDRAKATAAAYGAAKEDKDVTLRLQAKYAF